MEETQEKEEADDRYGYGDEDDLGTCKTGGFLLFLHLCLAIATLSVLLFLLILFTILPTKTLSTQKAMGRCGGPASDRSIFDSLLDFWVDWQITMLMIFTMSLQLFLVLAAFFRKHTSNPALHAFIWVAFLSIDACAAYALGLMLASGCDNVFTLYAPILLFHLGAADAINAYAPADNDLWHRYGFKMALEIIAAAYIVSRSSECPNFTTSGVLLFVVGSFKYGERIFALRSGSQAQILGSARPIYKYMALDDEQTHDADLLVSGEQEWYQKYSEHSQVGPNAMVTFKDIKDCQSLCLLMGPGVIENVCLAYALFKVFRRRLTNLHIYHKEKDCNKVRKIFGTLTTEQIRKVIDLELSFIFDGVYSKGSAGRLYQGIGVINRLVSAVFLFTAAIELITLDRTHFKCLEQNTVPFGVGLANLLVIVALVIECVQILKIWRSNWLRVWLACNYIMEGRLASTMDSAGKPHQQRWTGLHHFNQRAIACAFRYVGTPKSSHWNFKLEQLSIMIESLNLAGRHYLCQFEIGKLCEVKKFQLKITNLAEVDIEELQGHVLEKMVERYKVEDQQVHEVFNSFRELCRLRRGISEVIQFDKVPDLELVPDLKFVSEDSRLENIVLNCHLFTSVFEIKLLNMPNCMSIWKDTHVKVSIGLSRYCMYLMIKRPKLVPEDPDVAKGLFNGVSIQLKRLFLANMKHTDVAISCALVKDIEDSDVGNSMRIATKMLIDMSKDDLLAMAISLSKVWVDILIYITIAAENAHPHTEQMAKGGELLTHFWVLLGHIGTGYKRI